MFSKLPIISHTTCAVAASPVRPPVCEVVAPEVGDEATPPVAACPILLTPSAPEPPPIRLVTSEAAWPRVEVMPLRRPPPVEVVEAGLTG